MRGVGDEGGVQGLLGGAGRLRPPGAEQSSKQRGGVGKGLAAVAGRAVAARGGPPAHVGAANDGPLQEKGRSDLSRDTRRARGHTADFPEALPAADSNFAIEDEKTYLSFSPLVRHPPELSRRCICC